METVARLQSILFDGQSSFVGESWENPDFTFESAATVGHKLRLVDSDLV